MKQKYFQIHKKTFKFIKIFNIFQKVLKTTRKQKELNDIK